MPIDDRHMMIDLIARLGMPVVLAARSGLGTINHTLLSLEALRRRGIPVLGVVMSGPLSPGNREAIERFGDVRVLAEIRRWRGWTAAVAELARHRAAGRLPGDAGRRSGGRLRRLNPPPRKGRGPNRPLQPPKRGSGKPRTPSPCSANRLPRATPSCGKRGSGGGHGRDVQHVQLRAAEHHAGDLLDRHLDDAVHAAVGRVAHQLAVVDLGVPQ